MNKQILLKLLKLIYLTVGSNAAQFLIEWAVTVGAAALAGTAVHIPGVLQTGSAAFAAFTALRYFLVPKRPAQSAPQAPKEDDSGLGAMAAAMSAMAAAKAAQDTGGTGAYL